MRNRRGLNLLALLAGGVTSALLGVGSSHAQSLAEALDATNLVWTTGGYAVWFAQTTNTHDGVDAVRSGSIQSNQTSWIETTVVGPATISFWSRTQWDPPGFGSFGWTFTVNGARPESMFGITSFWSEQVYDLGEGTNVLRWTASVRYGSTGTGFVCLDEFAVLPPRPLAITSQPADTTVYSGETAVLSVQAIGTPPPQYQWRKDGTNIVTATNDWLVFGPATTNDIDIYSVVVSNVQGSVVSSNALLTVLPPTAPFFIYEPESTTAYTGQSLYWWTDISGSPPFVYQWRKDGTNLPGANGSSLIITNVSPADAGSYTLLVTNDCGSVESSNAVLTVIASVAPGITRQPRSLEVAEGVNTWMTVEATGVPDPSYVWTRTDTPPAPPPGPLSPPQPASSNPRHSFDNVTTNDAGIYFVTVSNYGGDVVSRDALLTVLPPMATVGSWDQDAQDVFVTNGLAFLARGTNGLAILNVSNPASPQLLGSCDTDDYASAVWVAGNLAYVADGAGLQIISVTNPSTPVLVGNYDTPGNASDVVVRDNLAFVAARKSGLLILSVTNPAAPTLVGGYATNLSPDRVCLSGNLAYLTSLAPVLGPGSSNWVGGMLIVDVANPAHPMEVGRWGTAVRTAAARDQFVFANNSVIEVTNPAQPVAIGSLNYYFTNFPPVYQFPAADIQVVNDLVYVAGSSGDQEQLFVFDARDPAQPIPVGFFSTEGYGSRLWVDGNHVYIVGYGSPLRIIETPFNPQPVPPPALSVSAQAGVKLYIQGRRGLHYDVEFTDQLPAAEWQVFQTVLLTNDSAVVAVPADASARFFRLRQLD